MAQEIRFHSKTVGNRIFWFVDNLWITMWITGVRNRHTKTCGLFVDNLWKTPRKGLFFVLGIKYRFLFKIAVWGKYEVGEVFPVE